jgi:hypothetical protein
MLKYSNVKKSAKWAVKKRVLLFYPEIEYTKSSIPRESSKSSENFGVG